MESVGVGLMQRCVTTNTERQRVALEEATKRISSAVLRTTVIHVVEKPE